MYLMLQCRGTLSVDNVTQIDDTLRPGDVTDRCIVAVFDGDNP